MARYRLTEEARDEIVSILRASRARFGDRARTRYRELLIAAFQQIAEAPVGALTRDRSDVAPGLRHFHLRHSRRKTPEDRVAEPTHLVFYRAPAPELVVILRVLHDRMDPSRYLTA